MRRRHHSSRAGALAVAAGLALAVASAAAAQDIAPQMPELPKPPRAGEGGLTVYPLRGGLYMITGPGANSIVSVGPDGVLVVDPQPGAAAEALMAEIRKLTDKPVHYVLNTTGDPDHVGGNQMIAASGVLLEGGNTRPANAVYGSGGAPIWAHEGVLNRLSSAGGEPVGWPTDTYFVDLKDMFVNGEPVQLMHPAANAHTDGDSIIMFRRNDVIAAGDIYTPDRYPVIDLEHGGSIDGLIDDLNAILRLTVPEFNEEGGTWVVPGHGRLSDEADVSEYRDMVTIVRDRIRDMVRKKMSLEQVKAAKPTFDYDPLYGADKGAVFVEQVYRSLTQPPKKPAQGGQP
jgi:glyoxylase-like metal-dependent hydrolase (beta-lactamase superfamily II)